MSRVREILRACWRPALLAIVTFSAFYPAWRGGPVFDDQDHLTPPELASWHGLGRIWTELGAVSQYYPLTHTAFWVQHRLWGDTMLGYHLVNLALHFACAWLLARLMERLGLRGAWFAAFAFALHPIEVETAAWVSELKNTLSGTCALLAVLGYLRFQRTSSRAAWWGAFALFVAALLAKAVVATVPAALLVILWWRRGRLEWHRDMRPLLPWFAVAVTMGLLCAWVERAFIGADGSVLSLSVAQRVLLAGRVGWFYAWKLFCAANLIFIYPRWSVDAGQLWQWAFPLLTALTFGAVFHQARTRRGPAAVVLLFAGLLFPVLGFLNVYPFVYSYVADHYQYLAGMVIIAAVASVAATAATKLPARGRALTGAVGIAVLLVLGSLSWRQSRRYVDAGTLWRVTLAQNPECFAACSNLSNLALDGGRPAEALELARRAVQLRPQWAELHVVLGNALRASGDPGAAESEYARAAALRPGLAVAHYNLGTLALEKGDAARARRDFERAVLMRNDYVDAHVNLSSLLLDAGDTAGARSHLEQALRIRPDDPGAQTNLGNVLLREGQLEAALEHYRHALRQDDGNAAAWYNTGSVCVALERWEDGVAAFRRAVQLRPDFELAASALAATLAEHPFGTAGIPTPGTSAAAASGSPALR
jgi:tetratricopeptide (TPR) repeat protein